jgi:hypothetical protein
MSTSTALGAIVAGFVELFALLKLKVEMCGLVGVIHG